MFFTSWEVLERTIIVGILAYVALIFLLRISGKRTLSKMNAFDLIVTISLGSTLASALLSTNVAFTQAVVAFALLIFMQFLVTWLSVRSSKVSHLVKATPSLLLYRGKFLWRTMKAERVTEGEIRAAVREQGIANVEDVEAVVLETDGSLTTLHRPDHGSASALANVANHRQEEGTEK
jgi:uncharacterized membrane protein YcaP (DUF421 family)